MNQPDHAVLQATIAAKDMVVLTALAAIIHHHPNRDQVLNTLRSAQVHAPGVSVPGQNEAVDQAFQRTFQAYLSALREAERTLPA